MREKKIIWGAVFAIFVLINTASTIFAEALPFQKHLEATGLQFGIESPSARGGFEEAILLLNLPKVYILPNSPLYFLKTLWEGAQLILTSEPEKRGELLLTLAEKRLSEGIVLIKKGEWQGASSVLQKYQGQFDNAQNMLGLVRDIQKYDALRAQISRQLQNQALVVSFLERIGAGEVLGGLMPRMSIGGLELRPVE